MATILLSAAGAAVGGSIGGTIAGLSTAVVGRAVGATLGRVIDQSLMGQGSRAIETGRVDRFRLTNAGEGEAISQLYGRMRVGGQVIWASDFLETSTTSGGGKGAPSQPKTTSFSYSVSLAVALCEGEVSRVGRVWADGEEISLEALNMRFYPGTADQLPDPLLEAIEGEGAVPAYRGTAYVVFEALDLAQFGNRIPQFSFEVSRPDQPGGDDALFRSIEAVAIMPGTGEYTLATTPVNYTQGQGSLWSANINTPAGAPDFSVSLNALREELPNVKAGSLIVSWFGNDLRCGSCSIRPKVEKKINEGKNMPWSVAGLTRPTAEEVPHVDDDPVYGGTPADDAVVEAIHAMKAVGQDVMFYPFILMEQLAGNGLADPYGATEQPHLPWRGRITLDTAPGLPGSADKTAAAEGQVDAFFGTAQASDFTVLDGKVSYSGPQEWSFSRFILHYAALCAAAGGVNAFCIGSEMRGMTQVRGVGGSFPFVTRLKQLAAEVRGLLGHGTMIGYAADWSEYFGYQPQDGSGDRLFHLDPLWSDPEIDFIGIDNYMPLSDWRDGTAHLDAGAGSIYDLDYLRSNVEGGEGYDWYYASDEDRAAQQRTPISDGTYGEPWVWRNKDLRNWWLNPHHDRIGGVRQTTPTDWVPQSKPIWFTEYGCAAIDKGTNQPNKFLDPKSSESDLPFHSNGGRDDFIQMQYLRAIISHYADEANNPVSSSYAGPMVDMSRAFVWAWDARPYPFFPNNRVLWNDGENYGRGHWLNGRMSGRALSSVVQEVCERVGITAIDTSRLHGVVRGYAVNTVGSGRAALQPLMLRYGFDAVERDGVLRFQMRDGRDAVALAQEQLARADDLDGLIEQDRDSDLEMSGRVRVQFVQADGDFDVLAEEAVLPNEATHAVAHSELPLAMTRGEGRQTAERWLAEARVARDRVRFALPPSRFDLGAGDIVDLGQGVSALYRIDRVEQGPLSIAEAVRIEPSVYTPGAVIEDAPPVRPFVAPTPVTPLFLDLPLMRGDEVPHAPHVAATAPNWPGSVAVYKSSTDSNYGLNGLITKRATVGLLQAPLARAPHGVWDRSNRLDVRLISGTLEAAEPEAILAGANLAAVGDGTTGNWELIQFSQADLIAPQTYRLSKLLRGQLGTDGIMPDVWPQEAWFVLLDGTPDQIDLSANLRQVTQHFRIGPSKRGFDDPSYVHLETSFDGNGLRPYAPAHLRSDALPDGSVQFHWIRRSRIEGDNWVGEVPLGEDSESYVLTVYNGATAVRVVETGTPEWLYPAALQASDGVAGVFDVAVSQISARYGPGPETRLQMIP